MVVARPCRSCADKKPWSNSKDSQGNVKLADFYCKELGDFICRDCCIQRCWQDEDPYQDKEGNSTIPITCKK